MVPSILGYGASNTFPELNHCRKETKIERSHYRLFMVFYDLYSRALEAVRVGNIFIWKTSIGAKGDYLALERIPLVSK